MPLNEADTCRKFVVPKLQAAGWDTPPHAINEQQRTFTDGRVFFAGGTACRTPSTSSPGPKAAGNTPRRRP